MRESGLMESSTAMASCGWLMGVTTRDGFKMAKSKERAKCTMRTGGSMLDFSIWVRSTAWEF